MMDYKNTINTAITDVFLKLHKLDLQKLNISDNSKQYLRKYKENSSFFISVYSQLLQKCLRRIKNPVGESVFVDYGGGCGLLSLIANLIGFKVVVYNDIYEKSTVDARIISEKLTIPIDYFICGDADVFVTQIKHFNIHPDLICSFDVLEHIYNLDNWIKTISKIPNVHLIFMSGANSRNPLIKNRLKKIQKIAEYQGCEKNIRFNDTYLNTSFLHEREKIIRNSFPELNNNELRFLSSNSRGLIKKDIENLVVNYLKNGGIEYIIDHPTNSCDPYTGSWVERLIDLKKLKDTIKSNNLTVEITNSFYCYSDNKLLNTLKLFVNLLIKILGPKSLFLSPTITIEIHT
jgi:2-polyprenyl-3-methyl-5-hydroxy-6-metoxy-1,4-benzoquinol methylase